MRRLVVKILKNETILVVASILALISCFIVPPDKEYGGYIHASTISQLICLMLVECGFLSNGEEAVNLLREDYQTMLAALIAAGYMRWDG